MILVSFLRLLQFILIIGFVFIPQRSIFEVEESLPEIKYFNQVDTVFPEIEISDYPVLKGLEPLPEITAESAILMDSDSKVPIWSMNEQSLVYPASTTKLMTALVAVDYYPLDDMLVFPDVYVYPSVMGLMPGEKIKVKDALAGLVISSGNDAALLFADNYPGGYLGFVEAMNKKAVSLGLTKTKFRNPSGLHQEGHVTTAEEMAHLVSIAMDNKLIREYAGQTRRMVFGANSERHMLISTDDLLGKLPGLVGGKTGFTDQAGEVLATLTERDGRRVVCVVMRSKDRFGETDLLVNWAYRNVVWTAYNELPIR